MGGMGGREGGMDTSEADPRVGCPTGEALSLSLSLSLSLLVLTTTSSRRVTGWSTSSQGQPLRARDRAAARVRGGAGVEAEAAATAGLLAGAPPAPLSSAWATAAGLAASASPVRRSVNWAASLTGLRASMEAKLPRSGRGLAGHMVWIAGGGDKPKELGGQTRKCDSRVCTHSPAVLLRPVWSHSLSFTARPTHAAHSHGVHRLQRPPDHPRGRRAPRALPSPCCHGSTAPSTPPRSCPPLPPAARRPPPLLLGR